MSIQSLLRGPSEFDDPMRQETERHDVAERLRKDSKRVLKKPAYYRQKVHERRHVLASRWSEFWLAFLSLAFLLYGLDIGGLTWTSELTWPHIAWKARLPWAAIVITVATTLLHCGGWLTHDLEKTRRTLRLHAYVAIPCAAISSSCFAFLYAVRLVPDALVEALEPVSFLLPLLMNGCATVTAASMSSLTHYFGLPHYYEWRRKRAEEDLEQVTEFLATVPVASGINRPATEPPSSPRDPQLPKSNGSGSADPLKVIGSIVLALVPLLSSCAGEGVAAAASEAVVADTADRGSHQGICRIDGDRTATVSREGYLAAIGRLVANLPGWLQQHGCTELRVGLFADEGAWREDVAQFPLPAPPRPSCNEPGSTNLGEEATVPKTFHDLLKRDLRRQEAKKEPDCRDVGLGPQAYEAELVKLQEAVQQALTIPDPEIVREGTTDIYGVLVAGNFGAVTGHLVVTDVLDTGHHELPPLKVRAGYRPEFVIVPVEPGHSWATPARVHERLAAFQAAVPVLDVHYYDSISATTWRASR